MFLQQISTLLDSSDPQQRMRGIRELRNHSPGDAVPLLKRQMFDSEFIIRSFVAMGLGYKQTEEGYDALLDIIARETDPNVIAEAANSLAKYGDRALPHLGSIFKQHSHWLVRLSILAALEDFDCPALLLELCHIGYEDEDSSIKQISIAGLRKLADTSREPEAIALLLQASEAEDGLLRAEAARTLRCFKGSEAETALHRLRNDADHRVIGATLEGLLQL